MQKKEVLQHKKSGNRGLGEKSRNNAIRAPEELCSGSEEDMTKIKVLTNTRRERDMEDQG